MESMNEFLPTAPPSWLEPKQHYLRALEDPWYKTLARIQHMVFLETVCFFGKRGFKAIQLPITTGSISSPSGLGSDSSPVRVTLLGTETYLADSMQFMLEYGCRLFDAHTFYVMPSFRGDEPDTTHLNQFYHNEAEIIGDQDEVLGLVEDYLRHLCRAALEQYADAVRKICGRLDHMETLAQDLAPFQRIPFESAMVLLSGDATCIRTHPNGARSLTRKGEAKLTETLGEVVWLTDFDHLSVPFYQAFNGSRVKAKAADLLFAGIGEVVGSGERHASADLLLDALRMHQVSQEPYQWYVEMKRQHPKRTSGFGMGVERFTAWLLQCPDVRHCQILPRLKGLEAYP